MAGKSAVLGMGRLDAALKRVAGQIHEGADQATDEGAELMADDMRARVPVDKGDLLAGIEARPASDGVGQDVGVYGVAHGGYVEFGTSDAPAQPFAGPAAETARNEFPKRVSEHVGKAI